MKALWGKLVKLICRPRWVVNASGEMAFRFLGVNFSYYKWADPEPDPPGPWMLAEKREFGETVKSRLRSANWHWPKDASSEEAEAENYW